MCGITGFVGYGSEADLEKMISEIIHRGPDRVGIFLKEGVGLAHARLSIIDLTNTGNQPMISQDGFLTIIFNGEIYNFKELKKELERKYKFKGNSDTEVILYGYQEYGGKVFEKLEGMFALALYDFQKKELILARDRLGKKPLYYSQINNNIVFSSEVKSLLRHPLVKKRLNQEALEYYLLYDAVPTPLSIYEDIYKLEPGYFLLYREGLVEKKQFWQTSYKCTEEELSENEILEKLDYLIERSVRDRMVSDVPLGVFLSGGLDSSIIAYYTQKNSSERINTFSIGFSEKSYDESLFARQVADHLGTLHHSLIIDYKNILETINTIFNSLDEPLADYSIIPTYILSKFTRKKVTVALGGDGGDELFAGYPTFIAHKFSTIFQYAPLFFINGLKKISNYLPYSNNYFNYSIKIQKFLSGVGDLEHSHDLWMGSFSPQEQKKILKKHARINVFTLGDVYKKEALGEKDQKYLYLYLKLYLMDKVMVKVDRASMMNSLETRSPLLDYRLVDFANRLPYKYKVNRFTTKYILKKLGEKFLPKNISYRKKQGFSLPISKMLQQELRYLVADYLSESFIERQGIFHYAYINKLKAEHFLESKNNFRELWSLISFNLWWKKFLD